MGFNSGEDYRVLSRALRGRLGAGRWIPHHLFLSAWTKVRGRNNNGRDGMFWKRRRRGSGAHLCSGARGMNVRPSACAVQYAAGPVCVCGSAVERPSGTSRVLLLLHPCKQCLPAMFCAADWHNKATDCCEDMLGCLTLTLLYGPNHSIWLCTSPQASKNMCQTLVKSLPQQLTTRHGKGPTKTPEAPPSHSHWGFAVNFCELCEIMRRNRDRTEATKCLRASWAHQSDN